MSFDIEKTLGDMTAAISGVISSEWPNVQACISKAMDDEKVAFADIAKARLDNEIDDEDMQSQLEDEKVALEAALLACQVKAKAMAQKAANAAVDVLKAAIKAAL